MSDDKQPECSYHVHLIDGDDRPLRRPDDELRQEVKRLRGALAAAHQRAAEPHPQRDLVAECNEALAAKDVELAECRRLLREAVAHLGDVRTNDDDVKR